MMSSQYDDMQGSELDSRSHPDTNLPSSEYWAKQPVTSQIQNLSDNMRANSAIKDLKGRNIRNILGNN